MKKKKMVSMAAAAALLLTCIFPANAFAEEKTLSDLTIEQHEAYQYEGQPFNSSLITVTAVYSDGSQAVLSDSEYDISGFSSDQVGEDTITVSYEDIKKDLVIEIAAADFIYQVGTDKTLSARSADESTATWTSSDDQVVRITDTQSRWVTETSGDEVYTGYKQFVNVEAVGTGVAVLTCETSSGYVAGTAVISVNNPIENFWVSDTEIFMETGNVLSLDAVISPVDADETRVSWISDDPQVASVSRDGHITAISHGETVVSAISWDGRHRAECVVYVTEPEESIKLVLPDSWQAEEGMFAVQCFSYPDKQKDTGFRITSSDIDVASFEDGQASCDFTVCSYDDYGILMRINGEGDVTLSAETQDGRLTDELRLRIIYSDDGGYTVINMDDPLSILFEGQRNIRLYGNTRYDTSLETAEALKKAWNIGQFDNIIVASGEDYADALAGSYLAKVKNAPILLVGHDRRSQEQAKEYISDNIVYGGGVYILGGTGAVSDEFEDMLTGYDVKRLGGDNRYVTNLSILEEAGAYGQDIVVCSGMSYADSLSASAAGRPVLLVNDRGLYDEQKEYLDTIGVKKYYIIGGTAAVNDMTAAQINTYGPVMRVAGGNRYETSAAVAMQFSGTDARAVMLVYGDNFPDGLSGGALAMAMDAPLLLVNDINTLYAGNYVDKAQVGRSTTLGGPLLISDEAVGKIMN